MGSRFSHRPSEAASLPVCSQRIDRIQSTLSSDLDHHFSATLIAFTESTKLLEVDKAKLLADLTECLRTYDMLGLWGDAEDVIRRDVVRRFVRKVRHSRSPNFFSQIVLDCTCWRPGWSSFTSDPPHPSQSNSTCILIIGVLTSPNTIYTIYCFPFEGLLFTAFIQP